MERPVTLAVAMTDCYFYRTDFNGLPKFMKSGDLHHKNVNPPTLEILCDPGVLFCSISPWPGGSPPGLFSRSGASRLGRGFVWPAKCAMRPAMTDRSPLARPFPDLPAITGVVPRMARAHYKTWDRCDLTFITFEEGTIVAGVTTQN